MSYEKRFLSLFQEYIHNKFFPWSGHEKLGIKFLLVGLCAGLAVRIGMLWFIDARFDTGDALGYLNDAQKWFDFYTSALYEVPNAAPSNYRPPLYPMFIALLMAIFGKSLIVLQLVQIVLSLIAALLITRVAATLAPKTAPWVFGAMLLSPYEAVYPGVALTETITMFLIVASAFTILTFDGLKRWIVGGLLLGLTALTRDIYLLLVVLVAISWVVFGYGPTRIRFINGAILVASACIIVFPWTLRNYVVTERFVPVSEGRIGFALWLGTWAINADFTKRDSLGGRIYPAEAYRNQEEMDLINNAIELFDQGKGRDSDLAFRSLAFQRMQVEPFAVIGRYFMRAHKLWLGTRFDVFQLNNKWFPYESLSWKMAKVLLWGLNATFMLLGFAGILLAMRQRRPISVLVLPIVYTAIVYFPLNSFENRYSQPVYPFVLVFAAISIVWLKDKLR